MGARLDSRQIVFDTYREISVVVIRFLLEQHFRELPSLPSVAEGGEITLLDERSVV
jgi:hypothetical protein